jgi:hypothetical protein
VADLELRGRQRPARSDLLQHPVHEFAPLAQEAGDPAPGADAVVGVLHAPAQQRL